MMRFAPFLSRGAMRAIEQSTMPEIGYKLCSEEQSPQKLIDCARRAEEVGFDFAMIDEARRTAHEYWPIVAFSGELSQILPVPAHFEQAAKLVKEEDVAKEVICGADPERHIAGINEYAEAGYDHVWIHQIGPDQEGFFRFYEKEILPKL
jgi:alkanesulfonate monooxygenase SsuD/methylene tetrahydromethanopterin reductase-like flavin-dependent oxidoreductase (luciferase family)